MRTVFSVITWTLFAAVVVSVAGQVILYISALSELLSIRRKNRYRVWRRAAWSPLSPRISILVPAHNEAESIVESVRTALSLSYPNLEVVVINDGSSDLTLERLADAFDLAPIHSVYRRVIETQPIRHLYGSPLEPRLLVVDKHNSGKADSLNAGLNVASGELFCAVDADTLISADALHQLVAPFLQEPDTVAVGGTIRLVNDARRSFGEIEGLSTPRNPLLGAQHVEYSRSFLIGRIGWNPLGGNLIISGAFGLFRADRVREVGGYESASVGEDMELVVRLRRQAHEHGRTAKVTFIPDPVAYTEAPTSLAFLARQRSRWFRGLLDVLGRHRSMVLRRRYGSTGMVALPYFILVEAIAPVLEMLGLFLVGIGLITGWTSPADLGPLVASYLVAMGATVLVLILDDVAFASSTRTRDRLLLLGHVVFEQLIFHPLTVAWRVAGLRHFLQGRTEWGASQRQGFAS